MSKRDRDFMGWPFAFVPASSASATTPAGKAIDRAAAAIARVETFLAAAKVANPRVAALILEQCQLAHMEAAACYAEASRLVLEQCESIEAEEQRTESAR